MASKLDQSLDEILTTRKAGARRGGRGRRTVTGTRNAPTGGIKKNTAAPTRSSGRISNSVVPAAVGKDSKIIVSNLPADVNEGQIKEYFTKSVGSGIKRVTITYGPNGVSRGIATIIFNRANGASDALQKLNGLLVDGRPMKIEVVLDAARAPTAAPILGLNDRVTKPNKDKPKSAASTRDVKAGGRGTGARGRGARRGRNAGRPKAKTADELDAEMEDYFDPNAGAPNGQIEGVNGATTTNGGDEMDEVS